MRKRNSILVIIFFLIGNFIYAYPPMKINDTGVRIRENPGLDGKIIRTLTKGESVIMITDRECENDKYKWIKVKTEKEMGWIYGEFVSLVDEIVPYKFISIDSIKLIVPDGIIEIGMSKETLLKLLGTPINSSIDDEMKEEWLDFYYKGKITIMITQYNNCVNQIILYTEEQELVNKTRVGININELKKNNKFESYSFNSYLLSLANYYKSSIYDTSIIINTNKDGFITRIQMGGSF